MFTVKNNNKQLLNTKFADSLLSIDGEKKPIEIIKNGNNEYTLLYHNKVYNVSVYGIDYETKQITLIYKNQNYVFELKDKFDDLLQSMGLSSKNKKSTQNLHAPMPGLVLQILVNIGDKVSKGDKLLILEAMKMENVLKANGDGIVKNILIKPNESIEKNKLLIEFE